MLREFTWCVDAGAVQDTELVTNTVKFGDGYEQVSSFGINNKRTSWQLSKTGYEAETNAVYQFLTDHQGVTPFIMVLEDEAKAYRTEGNISKAHLGANLWQVSFTVKRVFVP